VSKRDDDSQADTELGMTTAERRRRRRRGGGLRVPSDNVPRRTTPPVVAPVPEDPSLAMSIAYSFTNEGSEPIPRVTIDPPSGQYPVAPEPMSTVIDPPSALVVEADFEMKTREMSAVDLEALGLNEPASSITTTDPGLPGMVVRFKDREDTDRPGEVEVDMGGLDTAATLDGELPIDTGPVAAPLTKTPPRERKERLKTVALTDEDLEEVREAVRAATTRPSTPPATILAAHTPPPTPNLHPAHPLPPPKPVTTPSMPVLKVEVVTDKTMELKPIDIEADKSEEPLSVPEIDIQELSERSAESGEIEVDVNDEELKPASVLAPIEPNSARSAPVVDPRRSRPPSVPPPLTSTTNPPGLQAAANAAAHPPPPPPAQHKSPPTPPPAPAAKKEAKETKEKDKAPPVGRTTTNDGKLSPPRGKAWFVDLFDEDYLRTLPFLTPQATQAEAEFVIDAMGLTPGAQVLDVGCGYGRHAMELAARGFHVVGLDLSTPLLIRGGEEAQRRGLQINFVRGDMRELDFESQFDGAYCLFSTFGYFDDETNKKTVANIARALKPGGRVMIEILNRDYVIADLPTRVWWEGDGCVVLEEVELNYFSSRIQVNRSVVFDDGRQLEQEISVRAYALHEVGKLMHAAGFRVLEVSGGYHTRGRFFGNQSRHIIVLAERKEVATSSSG